MKRLFAVLLCFIVLLIPLTGCSSRNIETDRYIFKEGKTTKNQDGVKQKPVIVTDKSSDEKLELFFVKNDTIKYGENIYTYSYSENSLVGYEVRILYPDGNTYLVWFSANRDGIDIIQTGGRADNTPVSSDHTYPDVVILANAIQLSKGKGTTDAVTYVMACVVGFIGFIVGLLTILYPKEVIAFRTHWFFEYAKPTEFGTAMAEMSGIFGMLMSVIAFALGIIGLFFT